MPISTATREPGTSGSQRRSPRTTTRLARPTTRVAPLVSPSWEIRSAICSKKSPLPFGTPNSFGSCPAMIVSASPTMKPFSTGSEMNDGEEAQPQQPGQHAQDPGDDRQGRGQGDVVVGARLGVDGDDARRQGRGGRHRGHHQVTRGAEDGVQDERGYGGVQTHHRGHARDGRVGEGLRHQDGPHREPGQQVRPQPRGSVVAERGEQKRLPSGHRLLPPRSDA